MGIYEGSTIDNNLEDIFRKSLKTGLYKGWKIDDINDR